ncbi:MAG: flagellar basal-body rod protein FlgG [Chitinivibrionales bacterium]|nr:flagellar basal-body rod protein FlgG [Chitinivibrionales bacterium]
MIRSMYTAATGMEAQQLYMDTISNNLANVNTTGFKRQKIEFQDLMYQMLREPGVRNFEGSMASSGIDVGMGVKTGATQRIFETGSMNQTTNNMDLAIEGEGLFQIVMPDGSIAYTRDGSLKRSADGTVVTSAGFPLADQITIPPDASEFLVASDGMVTVMLPGDNGSTEIGQIDLAKFVNPAGLKAIGGNLFVETEASGIPIVATPGTENLGTIRAGFLEASNVQIVEEMVNMISAQRAFEIVSKSIQASEDMLQIANNLKR